MDDHAANFEASFLRIPVESVSLCVEDIGLLYQGDIISNLVEDVSYRLRQIVNVSVTSVSVTSIYALCR